MSPPSSPVTGSGGENGESTFDSRRLAAELMIEGGECGCPAGLDCDRRSPIDHHVIDDTCHITSRGNTEESVVQYRQTRIDAKCICRIIASYGCNPSLKAITEDGVLVRTNPPDRETLRDVITELREIAESVRLQQLVTEGSDDERRAELVNLRSLTDTERETIEWAIVAGYYDRPRTIDFAELADEIGISKSALSKRLSSAEAKVMRDLFTDGTESGTSPATNRRSG